jgi:hypothetical protein
VVTEIVNIGRTFMKCLCRKGDCSDWRAETFYSWLGQLWFPPATEGFASRVFSGEKEDVGMGQSQGLSCGLFSSLIL